MTEGDISIWRGRFFRYAPLFLWVGLIFVLSSSVASMSETSRVIRPFLEFIFPHASDAALIVYHGYIRKIAHFVEYAVLAFWAARAFWNSSFKTIKSLWYLLAVGVVLVVAIIDEGNQSFTATRTGSLRDVLLDGSGGVIMTLLLLVYNRFRSD